MVLDYFSSTGLARLSDVAKRVVSQLPFATNELEVSTKVKKFLSNIALGMVPTRDWDGTTIGGGCIFVKNDGGLVCFTLYDMDKFDDYLLKNTKFDTASTTRHKFGKLYKSDDGRLCFALNTDIRFIH
jgi:type II restriction enzyme